MEDPTAPPRINCPQRKCLSHLLRNSAEALIGIVELIESGNSDPKPEQLAGILRSVQGSLGSICSSLERGSFCALPPEQCQFVAPFVGCDGTRKGEALDAVLPLDPKKPSA